MTSRRANRRPLSIPRNNSAFWAKKFEDNVRRDADKVAALLLARWDFLVLWECEIKERAALERTLTSFLDGGEPAAKSRAG